MIITEVSNVNRLDSERSASLPGGRLSTKTLYRLSGIALLLGGLLVVLSYFHKEILSANPTDYASPLFVINGLLHIIGTLLILIGLPGLYAHQAGQAGWLGLVSFIMNFLGLAVLDVSTGPLFTFIPPLLAGRPETQALVAEPGALDMQLGPLYIAYFLSGLVSANLGVLLLGIATLRARVFPRWTAVLLITSIPVLFILDAFIPFGEAIGIAIVMLGFAGCGYSLLTKSQTIVAKLPDSVRSTA